MEVKGRKMRKIDETAYIAEGARIVRDVVIGRGSSVWFNAVLRGDDNQIVIGERSNIQDNCVIHVGRDHPTVVGDYVSVGHMAILHGCTIGDHTTIGMGTIIMNGARIGDHCIIGAGSLVTMGTIIPDHSVAFGRPAKVVRLMTPEDIEANEVDARFYYEMAEEYKEAEKDDQ